MANYAYGNLAGPGPSYFRTDIEYNAVDVGNGIRLSYTYFVDVTAGDFYGTNITKSWGGTVSVTTPGWYGQGYFETFVPYGGYVTLSAYSYYTGGSGTHRSDVSYTYYAPTPRYIVSYNANGGMGAPSSQTKTYGVALTLSSQIPTRQGYTFVGWNTNRNAGTAQYNPGSSYTANASATLYAIWKLNKYNVTFDASTNGGQLEDGAGSVIVVYDHGSELGATPNAVKKNHEFLGWNELKDGTGRFADERDRIYEDATLYAIFKLSANCYIKKDGKYKAGMMYQKIDGVYKTGTVSIKRNGRYEDAVM